MTVTLPLLILFGLVIVIALQITHLRKAGAPVTVQEMGDVRSSLIKLQGAVEALERAAKDDFSRLRLELGGQNQAFKLEIAAALKQISDQLIQRLDSANSDGNQKIELLRRSIAESGAQLQMQVSGELEKLRSGVSQANEQIRAAINERLEQMRHTVDEKLQKTLDSRLNESFRTVTEQLTAVHTGLGEMKSLASGVGDLKRVLTNVKARGTWGEVQLGALLEEMLRPEQYQRNAAVTGTNERVEFAIRLPGGEDGQPRWLPIDAKFPMEDYQRILEASEAGDPVAVEKASRGLEATLRNCARDIHDKYILEPKTTGFAILFLATEGLYAEALRRTGLAEGLQRDFGIMLAGPSTFAALLTSLRVGFRTLTMEQKASEIAQRLEEVKAEFSRYAGLIGKAKRRLQQASNAVEAAEKGTGRLQRSLGAVEDEGDTRVLDCGDDEDRQALFATGDL